MFTVYILRSEKIGKFYIGHTEDIDKRLVRHNKGQVTSTRGKGPWAIVYQEYFPNRAEAVQRELEIKSKKSSKYIERLIVDGGNGGHVPT